MVKDCTQLIQRISCFQRKKGLNSKQILSLPENRLYTTEELSLSSNIHRKFGHTYLGMSLCHWKYLQNMPIMLQSSRIPSNSHLYTILVMPIYYQWEHNWHIQLMPPPPLHWAFNINYLRWVLHYKSYW